MKPVFLIGAARSGTKVLRDVLGEHPDVGAVPFDINYLWRLGHEQLPHDAIQAPLSDRARSAVGDEMKKHGSGTVLEKTVSNCLRIPAIAEAFPEASFVFLLRDGYDVCESAMRQWTAPFDWRYSVNKALSFPWLKAPKYAFEHLRASMTRSSSGSVGTWGPRYPGIDNDVAARGLAHVCARQWELCVTGAYEGFVAAGITPEVARYEDFANDPLATVNRLHSALGLSPVSHIDRLVQSTEIGKGRRQLARSDLDEVEPLIESAKVKLNEWIALQ